MSSKFLTAFNQWKPVIVLLLTVCAGLTATGWSVALYVERIVESSKDERDDLRGEFVSLKEELSGLEEQMSDDRYTLTAASEKALRTAIENPGMRVPDPRNPSEIIVVKSGGQP